MNKNRALEVDIRGYVESNADFCEVLQTDTRYETFYHLSETRRSLLNWYSFRHGARLLEIGGEYGALTGLFCEKCQSVVTIADTPEEAEIISLRYRKAKNLQVKAGSWKDLDTSFDYIVLIGKLSHLCGGSKSIQTYTQELSEMFRLLKTDGTLLFAVDNRYGLRYFCGERDPICDSPFRGLSRYPGGSDGYVFSRQEIIQMIQGLDSGMKYKFYYPLPDYRFPQLIYTDAHLPDENVKERLQAYTRDISTIVMDENRLYDDIAENGVFPFFSNSFFVECSRNASFDPSDYIALSTDRGERHGFATIVRGDGTVCKHALYPAGMEGLNVLMENINSLAARDIKIVPHKRAGNSLWMPRVELPTLSLVLKRSLKHDPDRFLKLFDILYHEILKSSEQVELRKSVCAHIRCDPEYWGPILKRAYIDMIPINCFVDQDSLIFFDQEFVRENFPAGYIMFRAIKYTYQFMPWAEELIPKSVLVDQFGLAETWSYYADIEKKFVMENRNRKIYHSFTKWCGRSRRTIKANIARLAKEENLHGGSES